MTTYYVSLSGSDTAAGTSPSTAWQTVAQASTAVLLPGDSILFQGGQAFAGTLFLTSPGSVGDPITIGSWGTGQATLTNATGDAIYVQDVGGYLIQGLYVTGVAGSASFSGIEFFCSGTGQLPAIEISDVIVSGWKYGVLIGGSGAGDGWDGITLTGGSTSGCIYAGILTYGPTFSAGSPAWNHTNVLVTGWDASANPGSAAVTTQWTGSGIVLGNVNGGLITGCTAAGNGTSNGCVTDGPVGIWCYASTGVVISGCLSCSNSNGGSGNADGDGFDLDIDCVNCTIESCLSYSNAGAGILCFGGTADTFWGSTSPNTVRANLCWGNGQHNAGTGDLTLIGNLNNLHCYGNTFASVDNGTIHPSPLRTGAGTFSNQWLFDNIFYTAGTGQVLFANSAYTTSQLWMGGNCYWSTGTFVIDWGGTNYSTIAAWRTATSNEIVLNQNTGVQADPLLLAPGTAPAATEAAAISSYTGLQLKPLSPCRAAGVNIATVLSIPVTWNDFYGTAVALPLPAGAYYPYGTTAPAVPAFPAGYAPKPPDFADWVTGPFTFLGAAPVFRAQMQSAQAISGQTLLHLDTILEDPYNGWSSGSTGTQPAWSWLCPAGCSGWYEVTMTAFTNSGGTSTDQIQANLYVNGSLFETTSASWGVNGHATGSCGWFTVPLLGGVDYLQMIIFSQASVNTPTTTGQFPTCEITWVST